MQINHKSDHAKAREVDYPPLAEQLHMLWQAMDQGAMPKVEPFYSSLQAVKQKHPKAYTTHQPMPAESGLLFAWRKSMSFVAIHLSNDYEVANKTRFGTQEAADARAREILTQFPAAQVCVA